VSERQSFGCRGFFTEQACTRPEVSKCLLRIALPPQTSNTCSLLCHVYLQISFPESKSSDIPSNLTDNFPYESRSLGQLALRARNPGSRLPRGDLCSGGAIRTCVLKIRDVNVKLRTVAGIDAADEDYSTVSKMHISYADHRSNEPDRSFTCGMVSSYCCR
jgi:hypothetical protein